MLNIKKGDEIIIPAHTYCASAIPFARHGAKIVWVDINENRVIDLSDLKKKITNKTKAVVAVHFFGFCIDVGSIRKIVGKKVKIIEDCAQAFGSQFKGKKAGTTGDYSCYSFHSQKNLTTLGEGGAVFIKSNLESKKVAGLRHNGHSNFKFSRKDYWIPAMGNVDEDLKNFWPYKFTLSEIQCAAGYLGIKKINKYNQIRINRAKKFIKYLSNIKELEFNKFFYSKRHVYHLLVAKCKKNKYFSRDDYIRILYKKYKIMCIVQYYPFYKYGILHGDPHLGNYTVCKNLTINLFDFGCMRFFKGKFIKGVIDLYNALKDNNLDKMKYQFSFSPFKAEDTWIVGKV